jgi:creatinine amidohydrolase
MRIDAAHATWPEAEDAYRSGRAAVLPFGALEQHGAHLPLATDTVMATALATRVADAIDGWLLPAVPFGYTSANDGFAGTLSLSFDTVRAVAVDLARSLQRSGASCLIVINGDYGNQAPLHQAARDIWATAQWPALIVDYPGLAEAAARVCASPPAGPGFYHADELETSIVLAERPELVHMDRASPAYPVMPATLGAAPVGLHEVSPTGVFGDPTAATAAKGEQLLDLLTASAVDLVRAFVAHRVGQPA